MAPILEVEDLSICISDQQWLVKKVYFKLEEGESIALMGHSGLGKTTLAYALMGLEPPSVLVKGSIFIFGKKLSELTEKEKRGLRGNKIAMIFQDPNVSLNPFFKIEFQLREVLKAHTFLNNEAIDLKIKKSLSEVGFKHLPFILNAYPHQLSGGEKQRVLIAMALLCNPKILIADEPTASLDLIVKVEILKLIKRLQKERNLSLFLITHDESIAKKMADQIYEIKEKRIDIRQFSDKLKEDFLEKK